VEKGFIRVTVQAKYLFDENSASLKAGAMDVINRLADVLQARKASVWKSRSSTDMDTIVNARDIDAERALLVSRSSTSSACPRTTLSPASSPAVSSQKASNRPPG